MTDVKVWDIEEMGYLVRGTLDRRKARLAAWRYAVDQGYYETDEARRFIKRARLSLGWYRCNPCWCGMGHRFDLGTAKGPGPGNFQGWAVEL